MTGPFLQRWRTASFAIISFALSVSFHDALGADAGAPAPEAFEEEAIAYDPFERVNRGVHHFNRWFDRWIFEPVAKGYDWVLPDTVQNAVSRAFVNLTGPTVMLNAALQGKLRQAGSDGTRFVVNSTVACSGFLTSRYAWVLSHMTRTSGRRLACGVWGMDPISSCRSSGRAICAIPSAWVLIS